MADAGVVDHNHAMPTALQKQVSIIYTFISSYKAHVPHEQKVRLAYYAAATHIDAQVGWWYKFATELVLTLLSLKEDYWMV